MVASKGVLLSLAAGALGATSGLVAKLGLDQEQLSSVSPSLLLPLRGLLVVLTLASNACMVAVFSRALQASPTSAEASLVSTAANLLLTATASSIFLGESLSFSWWLGSFLIVAGSFLVASDSAKEKNQ